MMSTKSSMPNQHIPLHYFYGHDDCCLCKAEQEIARLTAELSAERERNRWRKYPNEKPTEDRWYLVASEIDDSTLYPEREHKVFYKVENSRYSPEWGFNKQDWHITHWCKLALPEEE
jgi:hypothetical protein